MDFKNLFDDERAVSPVIGVILMVAITVILAAVIGTFVLGLGDQLQDTTPQASFGFDQSTEEFTDGANSSDLTVVTVTHESGSSIAETDLSVTVAGGQAWGIDNDNTNHNATNPWDDSGEEISAGSSFEVAMYDTGSDITSSSTITFDGADGPLTGPANAAALSPGDTVRIVYSSPGSDSSSTLATFEVQ